MRRLLFLVLAMTVVLGAVVGFSKPTPAIADDDNPPFFLARLIGFEETPAISSTGVGSFRAELINGGEGPFGQVSGTSCRIMLRSVNGLYGFAT